ncbi:hypothetical protein F5Y05DRAFT_402884 [Hypoxylon sp. FL0543]|nr:hypothetical protein F5Y05DRAFT_402884 [Hypoxylon sp. FL0543]
MAYSYSRRSSDSDRVEYQVIPPFINSPPRRRQSHSSNPRGERARFEPRRRPSSRGTLRRDYPVSEWYSDDSYKYQGDPTSSPRGPRFRKRDSGYDYNRNENNDNHISEAETGNLFVGDSLTFQEVEDEGLSKTFMISQSQRDQHVPPKIAANPAHREWYQPEANFDDGSTSRLFTIHASEYSLNKDGRQKVRLLCPDRPPPTEPDPSVVQFRWLHLQKQRARLDDLEKLVINSPYISGQLKAVTLNVLDGIKHRASRKLIGSPRVETGSIFRGINRYDANDDLPDEPVIFLASPYLLMNRQPSPRSTNEGHHMLSLLGSFYGYDVDSDRRDTEIMKRMNLGSSKDTLYVPQLWCLLVGNDVLITLSELPVQDLAKYLVEIDQKTSNLRRPLTVKVFDQWRRPHSVVIDADCNYVDFLRHTFALAKEETGTCVTDYELLDENRRLVTPQEWLTLIQRGRLQDKIFYIVPRSQLQQQSQSRQSQSQSQSQSQLRKPRQQEMRPSSPLATTRERRPYLTKKSASRVLINNVYLRDPIRPNRLWITTNRTMSPEPRSDYDPEKWALVKYQQNRNNAGNSEGLPTQNGNRRKFITWRDQSEHDQSERSEEEQVDRQSRDGFTDQDDLNIAENMRVISRKPTEYTIRSSSGVRGTSAYRLRGPGRPSWERGSLSRPRQTSLPVDRSPWRRQRSHTSNSRKSIQSYNGDVRGRGPNVRFYSRGQRSQSRAKGPNIIVNDATYAAAKPKLLSLGALSDNGQDRRSSTASLDIESDNESARSHPRTLEDSYTRDNRERSTSSDNQRQGRSREPKRMWNEEDSSEESPGSSDTDTPAVKGKTTIPSRLISLRAVIALGYPFVIEGDTVVLQRALNGPLIEELLKTSEYCWKVEATQPIKEFYSVSNSSRSWSVSRGSTTRILEPDRPPPPAASILPFFHWKVQTDGDDLGPSNADVILVQMLGRADQQLSSDKLYSRTYACTFDDFVHRHADLIDRTTQPIGASTQRYQSSATSAEQGSQNGPAKDAMIDRNPEGEASPVIGKGPDNEAPNIQTGESSAQEGVSESGPNINNQTERPDTTATHGQFSAADVPAMEEGDLGATRQNHALFDIPDNNGGGEAGQENKESTQLPSPDEIVMKKLLDTSQELLGTFLPREGSAPIQKVCKRFWGALDEIFRHILWSRVDATHQAQWAIRSFTPTSTLSKALPRAPTNKKTFADCNACKSKKIYKPHVEALDHLHSEHLSCLAYGKNKRPYDDPCFVWLRHCKGSQIHQARNKEVIDTVSQFLEELTNVKDLAMELHYLVATTSRQGSESESRPFLPERVFFAFQEIMSMYFFTSRQLSFINRLGTLQSSKEKLQVGSYWRKIRSSESDAQAVFTRACELLENSKADIILSGITTRSPDTLGIESVGPHFLAAALAANLQNRPLLPDTETDAVQLYHEYTSKLRYQAYRRPRRRVFLEIHRLQEDLEALQNVVSSQLQVLDNYKRLLAPGSYRVTDSSRKGLFRIESRYIDSQIDRLRDKSEELRVQRERTNFLKEQVKQTIEILEENHGKAIRVFTLVTVFFLPLSFISSFFGMNTTDIRDTDYDQRFFWTVAIPVTFVVLALAFFYGYKGDSIEERILTLMHARSERRHQELLPKEPVTRGTATSSKNIPVEHTARHRLPLWLKSTTRRKQGKDKSGINRRTTDMSYLT